MDQKRLFLAIAISVLILVVFQMLMPPPAPPRPVPAASDVPAAPASPQAAAPQAGAPGSPPVAPVAGVVPREVPRMRIEGKRVEGSISLLGARIDDLVLKDYRETVRPGSALVRLLEPRSEKQPYYIQVGWTAEGGKQVRLPDGDTVWTGSGTVGGAEPAVLRWDNGEGLVFEIEIGLDDAYMFTLVQRVRNTGAAPVALYPWARIRRDYLPHTEGYYILHEGLIGVLDGILKETSYSTTKSDGEKKGGVALEQATTGGWVGFTDKYWLTALVPEQKSAQLATYRYVNEGGDRFQVDFVARDAKQVPAGGVAESTMRAFAGAKEVHLLDRYEAALGVAGFDKAVDFGWFYFITKPFFYVLDWLYGLLGNFGLAILAFTLIVKIAFFPLANASYRSMSKMKLLAPKMQAMKEQYKDEPQKMQQAMMEMYRAEKVNPASGCLPILIQIPVFFALYKVIFTTIEMRQAPFYGWIRDLSAPDPTNIFNLFGLLPFDPGQWSPFLHMGAWPLIMGFTMWGQMKLNPAPPDPIQAKIFAWMPVVFTFMLASFPAGLVIYWTWNNLLTIGQQWLIMRQTKLDKPQAARV